MKDILRIEATPFHFPCQQSRIGRNPIQYTQTCGFSYFIEIRCVYEKPLCGPLFPTLVSEASRRFHVASFFDPDAPARPIRIPMPLDISPAGLRKYKKNTGFIISDMLCGKIKQIRKFTLADLVLSVLPWPFHKGLPEPEDTGPCKDPRGNIGSSNGMSLHATDQIALFRGRSPPRQDPKPNPISFLPVDHHPK